ncbi:hypothetical protein Ciccas_000408 [Cichlidogyrus casuarinus]|uniref:Dynein heavy chain C-terminal domain-containing protein n=1 Tax=Cichlidogyrus casuarinus TaxID=1844966 RepID=A0ABD2QNB2_9PLAT
MNCILVNSLKVILGSGVANQADMLALNGMVEYFVSAAAARKDWEVAPGVEYKLPSVLFNTQPKSRLTGVIHHLKQLNSFHLDRPEVALLNATNETYLGDDQYICSRLSWLLDRAPDSASLSHVLTLNRSNVRDNQPPNITLHLSQTLFPVSLASNHPMVFAHGIVGGPVCLQGSQNRALGAQLLANSVTLCELTNGRREVDLLELCQQILTRLPKPPLASLIASVWEQTQQNTSKENANSANLLSSNTALSQSKAKTRPRVAIRGLGKRRKRVDVRAELLNYQSPNSAAAIAFSRFVLDELMVLNETLTQIRSSLQRLINACALESCNEEDALGSNKRIVGGSLTAIQELTGADVKAAASLVRARVPPDWVMSLAQEEHVGICLHSPAWLTIPAWISDVNTRSAHLEKLATLGRYRVPAFHPGSYANPRAFFACLMLEAYRKFNVAQSDDASNVQGMQLQFKCEVTGRDKEHLREPPAEGVFIHGLHLWGCGWDRATSQLTDSVQPLRSTLAQAASGAGLSAATISNSLTTQLPVIHVRPVVVVNNGETRCGGDETGDQETSSQGPMGNQPNVSKHLQEEDEATRANTDFMAPVYLTRMHRHLEPVLELPLRRSGVGAIVWGTKGVHLTLRPY